MAIIYNFIKSLPSSNRFLFIITVPVIFYALNYPIRALVLMNRVDTDFNHTQILIALSYATIFLIILLSTFNNRLEKYTNDYSFNNIKVGDRDIFVCHSTFIISLVAFSYKFYHGKSIGLYSDESELFGTLGGNLILMFDSMKWFCIASCAIIYAKNKNKYILLELLIISSTIVFQSIASTAKGPIVSLLLFYLFINSITNSKINYVLISVASIFIYFYMKATYLIRYYGVVRGTFSLDQFFANYTDLLNFYITDKYTAQSHYSIAERFNYLDGLMLTMDKVNIFDNGLYSLGGIAELLNIFPRFIWDNRYVINFNIYLTQNIWGFDQLTSETPIGRIGESFFVLGYAGILYAVFYGVLFSFIQNKVFKLCSVRSLSMYFVVLYYYVWSDAHIVFYWKMMLWVAITTFILDSIYRGFRNNNLFNYNTNAN